MANRHVFFLSDSTGITAETLGKALMTQFDNLGYDSTTIPFVTDVAGARGACAEINQAGAEGFRPIVFSTLADSAVHEVVSQSDALVLDLFSVFIRPLELELNRGSSHAAGRFHGMVDRASYEVRIDAIDFTLNHDDGAGVKHYSEADVVLVGVSRSGKTPTCVYLALQFGIRAANYPLTEEDLLGGRLPAVLEPYLSKVFGLTIEPERLRQIRQERRPDSRYSSMNQCRMEVSEVERLFTEAGLRFLDTSSLSIEEIASRIVHDTGLKRRLS